MCVTCTNHEQQSDTASTIGAALTVLGVAGVVVVTYRVMTVIWPLYLALLIGGAVWVYVIAPARRIARRHRSQAIHHADQVLPSSLSEMGQRQLSGLPRPRAALDASPDAAGGWYFPEDIDRAVQQAGSRRQLGSRPKDQA